jgi:hypothetical protein
MDILSVERAIFDLISPAPQVSFRWGFDPLNNELIVFCMDREHPLAPQLVDLQGMAESLGLQSIRLKEVEGKFWPGCPLSLGFKKEAGDLSWQVKPPLVSFIRDDIDIGRATSFYSHLSHNPVGRARSDQTGYLTFVRGLIEQCLPSLPAGREADFKHALESARGSYIELQNSVYNTGAYSSWIAGKSGFNAKQANRRSTAYDRATDNLIAFIRRALSDVKEACGIADVEEDERQRQRQRQVVAKAESIRRQKEAKKVQNKLPIVNDPNHGAPVSKAWWNKTHRDYKTINVHPSGLYRYRSARTGGGLGPVYLHDSKHRLISEVQQQHETTASALPAPAHSRTLSKD